MDRAPRLTIGLPVYNGETFLAASLDALLAQTYQDFEIVLSDNASTDTTADICQEYVRRDPRVRYVRQAHNVGATPNHNLLIDHARGELFKWASADDVYAPELLRRCVETLDRHPEAVLAHCWTGAVDGTGRVVQAYEYPLATDGPDPVLRLRSLLYGTRGERRPADDFGAIKADDFYGVIRTDVLRRVPAMGSYYYADRTFMAGLVLQGPFVQHPEWLYFRRDHDGRAQHAHPSIRSRCANLAPERADPLRNPVVRLVGEYFLGYVTAVRSAPLTAGQRSACYRELARWAAGRAVRAVDGSRRRERTAGPVTHPVPAELVGAVPGGPGPVGPRAG